MTTDKPIELAQCSQCEAYVFKAQVGGIRVLVDPRPLGGLVEIRGALIEGRMPYRVIRLGNKPWKLQWVPPDWLEKYADEVVTDHRCGASHRHGVKVEGVPVGPQSAPVRRGGSWAPPSTPDALAGAQRPSQGLSILDCSKSPPNRATNATRHRSSRGIGCATCGKLIRPDDKGVWAVQHGDRMVWAQHDSC